MMNPQKGFTLFVAALWLVLISCGGGGGGDSGATGTENNTYTVYANPTDGRFFTETYADGVSVTYHGTKDDGGSPQSLDHIVVKDATGTKEYIYELDGDELEKIYAPDGIIFYFEPSTGNPTHLHISAESGDFQFRIPLTSISSAAGDNTAETVALAASDESKSAEVGITATSTSQNTYYLRVLQCGEPVENALVKMMISPGIGNSAPIGRYISDGWYAFDIPQSVTSLPSSEYIENCNNLSKIDTLKILPFCFAWKTYIQDNSCSKIDELLNKYKEKIPPKYQTLANTRTAQIKTQCPEILLGKISDVCKDGWPSADKFIEICQEDYFEILEPDPQASYAIAFTIKIGSQEAFETQSVDYFIGTDYNLEVDAPSTVVLKEFYTDPAKATTTGWYTAYASLTCADPDYGTKVTLAVEGSDGYKGSYEEEIYADATIHLDVPPVTIQEDLEKGVIDTLTVTAEGLSEDLTITALDFQGEVADGDQTKTWIIGVARTGTGTTDPDPEPEPEPPVDTCDNPPTTTAGQAGKYYYVKALYYPMPDYPSCFSAGQIEEFRAAGHYIREDEDRGPCTVCPAGYDPAEYNGSETCVSCPNGTSYSDDCCY